MPAHSLPDKELRKTIKAIKTNKGDRSAAAVELGISLSALTSRIGTAKRRFGKQIMDDIPKGPRPGAAALPDEEVEASWAIFASSAYNMTRAAEIAGMPRSSFEKRIQIAKSRGYKVPSTGTTDALSPEIFPIPPKGQVYRYFLTAAQNNTKVHQPSWKSAHALMKHYGGKVMVSTFMYIQRTEGSAKRGTNRQLSQQDSWYDPEIEPYVCDKYVQLAPGLVWCGHMNISPTASNPLSGLDSYTGRASAIFPHTQVAMRSVPTLKRDAAKFMWTTGAATLRNYIQRKVGMKAEFHHVFGGLLVEVDSNGHWWARQVSADKKGWIYDLDVVAKPDGSVTPHKGVEAIGFGDVHEDESDPMVRRLAWGEGGMVDVLRPKYQVLHDVLDFGRRSHHNRRNRHQRFKYHVQGRESVLDEIAGVAGFLNEASRPFSNLVVVRSNHDEHLEKWLNETDWHEDMVNAELHLELQQAMLANIRKTGEKLNSLAWVCQKKFGVKRARWLEADESFIICKDASGGIEMGMHGDRGSHGARGSLAQFARLGRKVVVFHSHHCGIIGPAWQGGTSSLLDLDYNSGPSGWSHTHVLVHRNGKRQMVTMFADKWRA